MRPSRRGHSNSAWSGIGRITLLYILSAILFACGSQGPLRNHYLDKNVIVEDPKIDSQVEDLSHGLDEAYPLSLTPEDEKVVSFVELENLQGAQNIRWKWYAPEGEFYAESDAIPIKIKAGHTRGLIKAWQAMKIKGTAAAEKVGDWTVEFYLSGRLLNSKLFRIDPIPKRWGLVIGVSSYKYQDNNIPSLKYVGKDAHLFHRWLLSEEDYGGGFPKDKVHFLTGELANTDAIERALNTGFKQAKAEDLVLIYFTGHGGHDSAKPRNYYLLTHETKPGDLVNTALPMHRIVSLISRHVNAQKIVIIMDTCHAGAIGSAVSNSRLGPLIDKDFYDLLLQRDACVISASGANQLSYESKGLRNSVFTHCLVRGLEEEADINGDETVNLKELKGFVEDCVEAKLGLPHDINFSGACNYAIARPK